MTDTGPDEIRLGDQGIHPKAHDARRLQEVRLEAMKMAVLTDTAMLTMLNMPWRENI